MSSSNKHVFAVYDRHIDTVGDVDNYTTTSRDVIQRLRQVLRVSVGDQVILFADRYVATCRVETWEKQRMTFAIISREEIMPVSPAMYWYVPLAEKAAFEDAIAYATIMGVRAVYPIVTTKSKQNWGTPKDFDRIQRVTIAAAEQAKQYARPTVHTPVDLHNMPLIADHAFVCDPHGSSTHAHMSAFTKADSQTSFAGLVGPQAGLTDDEIAYITKLGFHRLCLGPSILRMETAVAVAAGMIRALLTDECTPDSA